jgi:hypothetical protein
LNRHTSRDANTANPLGQIALLVQVVPDVQIVQSVIKKKRKDEGTKRILVSVFIFPTSFLFKISFLDELIHDTRINKRCRIG